MIKNDKFTDISLIDKVLIVNCELHLLHLCFIVFNPLTEFYSLKNDGMDSNFVDICKIAQKISKISKKYLLKNALPSE